MLKKTVFLTILSLLLSISHWSYAGVTTPTDVRFTADNLYEEELVIESKAQAIKDAEKQIKILGAEREKLSKQFYVTADDPRVVRLNELEKQIQVDTTEMDNLIKEAETLEAQLKQAGEDDYLYARYEEKGEEINALDARLVAANKEADALGKELAAFPSESDWRTQVENNKKDLAYQEKLLKEYSSDKQDLKARNSLSGSIVWKNYSWTDDYGNSGRQFYMPLEMNYVLGLFDFGIKVGYISSNNCSANFGNVNHLMDTILHFSYTQQFNSGDFLVYTLGFNLPTGKDAVHAFDPVMDEDVVEHPRFGEGFNVLPSVWYYHRINKMNWLIFGTALTFGGEYYTDTTRPDSWVHPSKVWVNSIQWKHLDSRWQFLASLDYTTYLENNEENGVVYRNGNRLTPNFTVNFTPDKKNMFTAYYWTTHESPLSNTNFVAPGAVRVGRSMGLQYAHKFDKKNRIRIYYDYMTRSGEYFNPLTLQTTDKRSKHTIGIGFDHRFNDKQYMSLNLERFTLHEEASDITIRNNFKGFNIALWYFWTF